MNKQFYKRNSLRKNRLEQKLYPPQTKTSPKTSNSVKIQEFEI